MEQHLQAVTIIKHFPHTFPVIRFIYFFSKHIYAGKIGSTWPYCNMKWKVNAETACAIISKTITPLSKPQMRSPFYPRIYSFATRNYTSGSLNFNLNNSDYIINVSRVTFHTRIYIIPPKCLFIHIVVPRICDAQNVSHAGMQIKRTIDLSRI